MKLIYHEKINKKHPNANIFTNMFSLLRPSKNNASWPLSLELPDPIEPSTPPPPKRMAKEVTACPHTDRKHYAKNMCNNCYHREGRGKLAWVCPHKDRFNYAKGKCQFCYLQHYHRSRVFGKRRNRKKNKSSQLGS